MQIFYIHIAVYGVYFLCILRVTGSLILNFKFGIYFVTLFICLSISFYKSTAASMYDSLMISRESNKDVSPRYLKLVCSKFVKGNTYISSKHKEETRFLALTVWKKVTSSTCYVQYCFLLNFTLFSKFSNAIFRV